MALHPRAASMKVAGLIGHPVGHSISPAMQQAAFDSLGLHWRYELWDTAPDRLEQRIASLRQPHVAGANVTVPHKEGVLAWLDDLEGAARRIGAVNTIVNRSGRLHGYNTDAPGFLEALRREGAFEPKGARAFLLGAGGAARAVAVGLLDEGAAAVTISNRSPERLERLIQWLRAHSSAGWGQVRTVPWGASPGECDLVVNATAAGMRGGPAEGVCPIDVASIPPQALVCDLVYNPPETPLLRQARLRGLRALAGLPMLVYQGAEAARLWTGRDPPLPVMFKAARKALAGGTSGEAGAAASPPAQ